MQIVRSRHIRHVRDAHSQTRKDKRRKNIWDCRKKWGYRVDQERERGAFSALRLWNAVTAYNNHMTHSTPCLFFCSCSYVQGKKGSAAAKNTQGQSGCFLQYLFICQRFVTAATETRVYFYPLREDYRQFGGSLDLLPKHVNKEKYLSIFFFFFFQKRKGLEDVGAKEMSKNMSSTTKNWLSLSLQIFPGKISRASS